MKTLLFDEAGFKLVYDPEIGLYQIYCNAGFVAEFSNRDTAEKAFKDIMNGPND